MSLEVLLTAIAAISATLAASVSVYEIIRRHKMRPGVTCSIKDEGVGQDTEQSQTAVKKLIIRNDGRVECRLFVDIWTKAPMNFAPRIDTALAYSARVDQDAQSFGRYFNMQVPYLPPKSSVVITLACSRNSVTENNGQFFQNVEIGTNEGSIPCVLG